MNNAETLAADRLLHAHLRLAPTDRVAFLHPESGTSVVACARALPEGQLLVSHRRLPAVRAVQAALALHGHGAVSVQHRHGLACAPGTLDVVVIRLPPERLPFHELLRDAALALRDGGRCLVVGATQEGIKPAAKVMADLFGNAVALAHGGGNRLLQSRRAGALEQATVDALVAPYHDREHFRREAITLARKSIVLCTRPGVFSWEHLDEATAVLAGTMAGALPGAPHLTDARVLDLGCGAGVLGVLAALSGAGRVVLVDADSEAVRCAAETARASGAPGVRALASDVTSDVRGESFDLVVTNPPFHVGKHTDLSLPLRFIEEARDVLAPGGRLLLVANRTLPYERELEREFGNRRTVHDGARFKVLEATRERAG